MASDAKEPQIHGIYRHYKGNFYIVEDIIYHSETGEKMVAYRALYGDRKLWCRPCAMFFDEVDQNDQKYRFELRELPDTASHTKDSEPLSKSSKVREIHKKISPEYFEKVLSGEKTFEYRVNDFVCEPGDILILDEYEYTQGQETKNGRKPTGRSLRKKVGYVGYIKDSDWHDRPDVKADFEKYGAQIISLLEEE